MKYFVPCEIALQLRELGFDEPCLAWYNCNESNKFTWCESKNSNSFTNKSKHATAPLYDQVIDWFIKTHKINIVSPRYTRSNKWYWRVELMYNILDDDFSSIKSYSNFADTREQSVKDSILKAIELVKQKK